MTTHTIDQLAVGTAIHYSGDVANPPANGTIVAIKPATRWGSEAVDIRLEDGRECLGIYPSMFDRTPGQRFHIKSEWDADRAEQIAQMRREFEAVIARTRVNAMSTISDRRMAELLAKF